MRILVILLAGILAGVCHGADKRGLAPQKGIPVEKALRDYAAIDRHLVQLERQRKMLENRVDELGPGPQRERSSSRLNRVKQDIARLKGIQALLKSRIEREGLSVTAYKGSEGSPKK